MNGLLEQVLHSAETFYQSNQLSNLAAEKPGAAAVTLEAQPGQKVDWAPADWTVAGSVDWTPADWTVDWTAVRWPGVLELDWTASEVDWIASDWTAAMEVDRSAASATLHIDCRTSAMEVVVSSAGVGCTVSRSEHVE